ncbi:hypothetical protein AMTRI_Chr01g104820 [Amborella trichopoda]
MYIEVEQLMRQPGFDWNEAIRMVTAEPAVWAQFIVASLCLYTSTNWRRYLALKQGMGQIEAMWNGEEIGVDVFLKASRHFKAIFLGIQSLLSLKF